MIPLIRHDVFESSILSPVLTTASDTFLISVCVRNDKCLLLKAGFFYSIIRIQAGAARMNPALIEYKNIENAGEISGYMEKKNTNYICPVHSTLETLVWQNLIQR
jgi:hypothetical protein